MPRLQKDSTIPSVASTSQEGQENRTLKVTLLSNEWKSSTDGGLSTINRELAIQLAKHPNVDVSVLLPSCSREDRSSAKSHNVTLIEAQGVPGVEPVLCLSSPPTNHTMHCLISHGVHLGRVITIIKRNPNYYHCKWIQVVHSAPEEDGMYRNISEGQKEQETEIELCQMADQVVTIGPKLAEAYKRYLCHSKQGENVFDLTPSIFSEFLEKEQATEERQAFFVLVNGSGDSCEDFTVKGYDIAAKAIAELKDESYKLRFVCAPGGEGDEIAERLLQHGVSRNQLLVRRISDSREVLANLFCEVDLAIMPSRTEGFGITALEAISAGLPILVSGNSGLGEALKKVVLGSQCVVDSEDPKDWAREIKHVRQKERGVRLSESRSLRKKYMKKYSWEEPCRRLVNRMYELTFGLSESGTISPISDKRPTPFVAADQPAKRLGEELIYSTHHELQGAEGPSVGHLPQSSMEYEQFSLSRVAASQNKPIDQRSFTQSLNRYPPSEHCQSPFAGASSTYCAGPEHQRSHPQGSSSNSSPAPVAVDHTQGSLSEAFVNQNYHGSQNYPQSHNRHPSSGHSQNPYAGASSIYYGGFGHQECYPREIERFEAEISRHIAEVERLRAERRRREEEKAIKWLRYGNNLRKKCDKWITLDEAKRIAFEECGIQEDNDFSTLMNYLHDQRIVIHFSGSPELERMVILDPWWLVDVLKRIITVRSFKQTEHPVKDLWIQLKETGILDERLIDHAWGDLLGNQESHKSLIAIMERLGLLSAWPSLQDRKQYLVPSMLKSPPTDEVLKLLDSVNMPSLFIKFASGGVPPGLLSRLILVFFQWCGDEWSNEMNPQLFYNFAMFCILTDQGISVIFWWHYSAIEVAVYSGGNEKTSADICRVVHWKLMFILECMRREFRWLNNMKYDMCVCCPVCSQPGSVKCHDHDVRGCECLHFLSESDLRKRQHCNRPGRSLLGDYKIRIQQFQGWFSFGQEEERAGMSTNQMQTLHATRHGGPLGEKGIFSMERAKRKDFALPESVKSSIQSIPLDSASDVKDIVIQFLEALQLEPASLTSPEPEAKNMIRGLAFRAKSEKRDDLVRHLREITPAGTTGPLLNEDMSVVYMPFKQYKDLTFSLSGGEEWKLLAERLGLSQIEIRFLDKRVTNPSDVVLRAVGKHRHLSVGEIYDTLVDCELPVVADLM